MGILYVWGDGGEEGAGGEKGKKMGRKKERKRGSVRKPR